MTRLYSTFGDAYTALCRKMTQSSNMIHTEKWQGIEVKDMPAAQMAELLFESFQTAIWTEDLELLVDDIGPNLPWADVHFETERVSGAPINPGESWKIWPWGLSADKHRTEGEKFNHTYAERFWPKTAGGRPVSEHLEGIRYPYGDLADVVDLLAREPLTRQAVLPVYFPEDTGSVHGSRVPCSIAYHFMLRDGRLHCSYWLRSCDLIRHFRDDVYLTVRLVLWMLEQLRATDDGEYWQGIKPGKLVMHMDSLHCFINDLRSLTNEQAS